ncbi:MAG: hypothetical protein R3B45_17660 [Bdellovibrionota bacterium]
MKMINKLGKHKITKILIALKVSLILGILATKLTGIYFGEVPLIAAKETNVEDETKAETVNEKATKDGALAANEEEKPRKSFLDDLLNLPKLDTTNSKKDEIGRYLNLAERKRQQIEERLSLLQNREDHLKNLEEIIDEKLSRLEEERLFFSQTIQKEKLVQEDRLNKLVELYEKMEPKKAGPVFDTLDRDLVVALFERMKQKTVTRILEVMDPARSQILTEYFGRIRSGKEYDILKEMNQSLKSAFADCKGMNIQQ